MHFIFERLVNSWGGHNNKCRLRWSIFSSPAVWTTTNTSAVAMMNTPSRGHVSSDASETQAAQSAEDANGNAPTVATTGEFVILSER